MLLLSALSVLVSVNAIALPPTSPPAPTVALDYATYAGSTNNGINSFLGMRFAEAPVGQLRFNRPVYPPARNTSAIIQATAYGDGCIPQQLTDGTGEGIPSALINQVQALPQYKPASSVSEDCLFVNVIAPANAPVGGLPVLVWIYGGGFNFGSTSDSQSGAPLVERSIVNGAPVVYVSMNYRLAGFGFLGGQEVKDAKVGNLGLYDLRAALEWIQLYIGQFGGDKNKVTIWGESAGAISVSFQMLFNNGAPHNLFRGAYMQSGAPTPVGSIVKSQPVYDFIVETTGCAGEADTLACLRTVPVEVLTAAIDQTPSLFAYSSLQLAYLPRVDGEFIKDEPLQMVADGKFNKNAFISTNCDDEGTLFSLSMANTTTDADALAYIKKHYIPTITDSELTQLDLHYPRDPVVGSPYDTGMLNQLYLQFKRLASFQADLIFQAPRRWFLKHAAAQQNVWVGLYKRGKNTPYLGSFHSSDLSNEFYLAEVGSVDKQYIDYILSFTNTLNPNSAYTALYWPQFTIDTNKTKGTYQTMTFLDVPLGSGFSGLAITLDTFRIDAMKYLTQLSLKYPS